MQLPLRRARRPLPAPVKEGRPDGVLSTPRRAAERFFSLSLFSFLSFLPYLSGLHFEAKTVQTGAAQQLVHGAVVSGGETREREGNERGMEGRQEGSAGGASLPFPTRGARARLHRGVRAVPEPPALWKARARRGWRGAPIQRRGRKGAVPSRQRRRVERVCVPPRTHRRAHPNLSLSPTRRTRRRAGCRRAPPAGRGRSGPRRPRRRGRTSRTARPVIKGPWPGRTGLPGRSDPGCRGRWGR